MDVNWVGILEATYAPVVDETEWAESVLESMKAAFGPSTMCGFTGMVHPPDCTAIKVTAAVGEQAKSFEHQISTVGLPEIGPSSIRKLYYPPSIVCVMHDILAEMAPESAEVMRQHLSSFDSKDALGLVVHPEPGVACVLFAGYDHKVQLSRSRRKLFTEVALHLETACRLRRRPEHVRAVISADGKLLHQELGAPSPEAMIAHVGRVERARTQRGRADPEALELWTALIEGCASVVERAEGSRRHYLVVENSPKTQPLRVLTSGEIDVLSFSARGLSAKHVAYSLGVAESTVSSRLSSAAAKMGVATRSELVRIAAMLTRDPRARFEETALTTAENEVLGLLAQGLSNADIAKLRSRSLRTIANQVASLLRKTQCVSRRALGTRDLAS